MNVDIQENFIDKYVKMIGGALKIGLEGKVNFNSVEFQAKFMLLKFEMGQYILNKEDGKNYKISDKGYKLCESLHRTINKDITETALKMFPNDLIAVGYIKAKSIKMIGEKLYNNNYLGEE
jgi:hypothetical protein